MRYQPLSVQAGSNEWFSPEYVSILAPQIVLSLQLVHDVITKLQLRQDVCRTRTTEVKTRLTLSDIECEQQIIFKELQQQSITEFFCEKHF